MRSFATPKINAAKSPHYTVPAIGNRIALAPPPADYIDARSLVANTPQRHAIPSGATFVLFSASGDFLAKFGDASVVTAMPSGPVVDGTAGELNPAARAIPEGVTHISLIASATVNVTLSFYSW